MDKNPWMSLNVNLRLSCLACQGGRPSCCEAEPVVLSTGGSIANLTKDWAQKSRFVEDLTLMGLAVAFGRQV